MNKLQQCLDKREWDEYILEHQGHPLQLWGWGDVKDSNGWTAYRLFLRDNEESVVGAVQMIAKKLPFPLKSIAYVPRGPVVDEANRELLLTELAKYVKRKVHSVALMIEPDSEEYAIPDDWLVSENRILPANTIILDLTKSEDALLKDMSQKTRRYIRKSEKEALQIKMVRNKDDLRKCMDIYHQTSKRAKFNLHKDQYYYDVFDKLGDHSAVFASYIDGQPICFLWLAISADTAYELYGAMNEDGQRLSANYALKWYTLRKCKEWGLGRYDFGGLIDGGITSYKTGWSSEETNLAGTYEVPLSMYYAIWRKWMPAGKKISRKIITFFKR